MLGRREAAMNEQRARFQWLILQAMVKPDVFLAAALGELTDEVLAAETGAPVAQVYRLRLMGWPRTGQWDHDIHQMATAIGADPGLLAGVLRRLGP